MGTPDPSQGLGPRPGSAGSMRRGHEQLPTAPGASSPACAIVNTSMAPPTVATTNAIVQPSPKIHTTQLQAPAETTQSTSWSLWKRRRESAQSAYHDPWFAKDVEQYPIGYPSLAANMSTDIDARIYRRFTYVRNRLLLIHQDKIIALEQQLEDIDQKDMELADGADPKALWRLTSQRYDARHAQDTRRQEVMASLEAELQQYDDLLLREHEICSIKPATDRQRQSWSNFVWNGKPCAGSTKKHLEQKENVGIYRKDDSLILGTQEDAWLGTSAEYVKSWIPQVLQRYLFADRADRVRSKKTNTEYQSNERINAFVKAMVCVASTILLVVPIVILYALSTHNASGWLKIGVMLIFVVAFALVVATLTNASRSEMFGASAGYTAVLIVFLTFTG